jgi:hypothetical protein
VTTRTTHILQLQRTAGNAATTSAVSAFRSRGPIPVQRHRTVQREITVETDQALPRTQIEPDAKSSNRLTVRYGAEVVAVIVVGGKGAAVDGIQVRDRTGARNQGGKIETVDLDILHPPGWTVTVEPVRAALARTKKSLGVGDVTISRGQSAKFGRLIVRLDSCRYPTGNPASDAEAHVTVLEESSQTELFNGWMLASSPALSALDHPRYDVWVLSCVLPEAPAATSPAEGE